jgi:hypothetical protein
MLSNSMLELWAVDNKLSKWSQISMLSLLFQKNMKWSIELHVKVRFS